MRKALTAENIVVDPVMVATSGAKLISDDAIEVLKTELFPLASVLTPNIPEAEILSGMSITSEEEMVEAAKKISSDYHCACLLKGGHQINDANDLLTYEDDQNQKGRDKKGKNYNQDNESGEKDRNQNCESSRGGDRTQNCESSRGDDSNQNKEYSQGSGISCEWFYGKRIDNPNTHGTGCTLSSAIASNLAKGYSLSESVKRAKDYISGALSAMLDLGKGSGPMNHGFDIKGQFAENASRKGDA